ncbi:hypothetical protein KIPB_006921, partial [Kipferlia bialata]
DDRRPVTLIYGGKGGEYLFREEIDEIAEAMDSVQVHYVEGRKAIASTLMEAQTEHGNNARYYLSGLPVMIKAYEAQLLEGGVSKNRLMYDPFNGY